MIIIIVTGMIIPTVYHTRYFYYTRYRICCTARRSASQRCRHQPEGDVECVVSEQNPRERSARHTLTPPEGKQKTRQARILTGRLCRRRSRTTAEANRVDNPRYLGRDARQPIGRGHPREVCEGFRDRTVDRRCR